MRSLFNSIEESRLLGPCRTALKKFGYHERRRRLDKLTQDFRGFCRWFSQSVRDLVRLRKHPDRRLLAIYDLTCQPFSIGDILLIQEASLVVREQHQLGQVDFALLYDPYQPACADPAFSSITAENLLFHLASVLPVAQVNPHHGSLFVFNSPLQLNRFIADNADRYHIWPSAWRFSLREYNYRHVFNDLLHNHYAATGALPHLGCRPFLVDWARAFWRRHIYPRVLVTMQIRNNKTICPERNLNIDHWLGFFRHCEANYPVCFVIIGARAEIDDRLRDRPNVIIAKDHGTSVEQDLALVHIAAIHTGASSGPGMMAIFNHRPYLFVNSNSHTAGQDDMVQQPDGLWHYTFATPYQHFVEPPESVEMLVREFARMWPGVNLAEWQCGEDLEPGKGLVSWLR